MACSWLEMHLFRVVNLAAKLLSESEVKGGLDKIEVAR